MEMGLIIFMVSLAAIFALWEIQIEGENGWAGKLPCWRKEHGWVVKLFGGKPITGYHFYLDVFIVLLIHTPVFFTTWSIRLESLLLAFCLGLLVLEDFLWFVFNPHYGLKNFKKEKIWWHKTWWGPIPDYYWFDTAIITMLFYFGWPAI